MNEYGGDGFIERKSDGSYNGRLSIEGVDISPIEGVYFKRDGRMYLWLKRKKLLVYDMEQKIYKEKDKEPRWETYLEKCIKDGGTEYAGEFNFLHFKYSIIGLWDRNMGMDRKRLNLFVERLPMQKQSIINGIRERNKGN